MQKEIQKEMTVWEPLDKRYKSFTPVQAVQAAEEYFRTLEETYQKGKEQEKALREKIDHLLTMGEDQAVFQIIQSEEFRSICSHDYDFYRFYQVGYAAIRETELKLPCCLSGLKSMEDASNLYQRLIFFIRRIEFDYLEERSEWAELLREIKASYVLLGEMLEQPKILEKQKITAGIYQLLMHFELRNQAAMFLFYRIEKEGRKEESAIFFSSLLLEQGEILYGKMMLQKINDPSPETAALIELLEKQKG